MSPAERLARIYEVFLGATALQGEARAEFISRACADSPSIRLEIEDLLARDSASTETGSSAAPTTGGGWQLLAAGLAEDEALADDPAPTTIGRFRILRELGRGGMGVVYEAEQSDPQRRVALKVIHPGMLGPSLVRRFRQETRVLAQLHHPGIAQVFEAGTEAGRPYFAMELVDGPGLSRYAENAGLSIRQRLELIARVCDAVHYAHQKGIIHRDLKPSNILVAVAHEPATGRSGLVHLGAQPKVLDFGVARLAEQDTTASLRTEVGLIIGTVPYLSPEQASGNSGAADTRVDVYSLGVIAFELLTGRVPFDVDGKSAGAACLIIRDQEPRRLGSLRPELRGEIETIVGKALEKTPERRYQSAADLSADIRRHLSGEAIAAHPPSTMYQLRKFVGRNRALVGGAAASLLILVAGVIVSLTLAMQARRAEDQVRRESYRVSLSAASLALDSRQTRMARKWLGDIEPARRGWEYLHLMSRLEQSDSVVDSGLPSAWIAADASGAIFTVSDHEGGAVRRTVAAGGASDELDPRLWLWYASMAGRQPKVLDQFDGVVYAPDPEQGVRAHVLQDWALRDDERPRNPSLSDNGHVMAFVTALPAKEVGQIAIIIADLRTNQCRRMLLPEEIREARAHLSPDGTRIAVSYPRMTRVDIFDTATFERTCELPVNSSRALRMVFTRDNRRMAAALFGGDIVLWNIEQPTGTLLASVRSYSDPSTSLRYNPDQSLLVAGSTDGLIRIWNALDLELLSQLSGHDENITSVAFLGSAGSRLASADSSGHMRLWNLESVASNPLVLRGHTQATQWCALSADGSLLASAGWDMSARIWDLHNGGKQIRVLPTSHEVLHVAFSPDQSKLVTFESDATLRVFAIDTATPIADCKSKPARRSPPAFHADGRRILIGWNEEGKPLYWNFASSEATPDDWTSLREVSSPYISARAGRFIRASLQPGDNPSAQLCSITDGRVIADFGELPGPTIQRTAFSPDGTRVAAVLAENRIGVFNASTGERLAVLTGHNRSVLALVYSADGSRLFSADYSEVIHVWETDRFTELLQLRGHTSSVRGMMVTPGNALVSTSGDGTIRVWQAPCQTTVDPSHSGSR